jgi:hypothetical protein
MTNNKPESIEDLARAYASMHWGDDQGVQANFLAGAAARDEHYGAVVSALENTEATLVMLSDILKRKGFNSHDLIVYGVTDAIEAARAALQNVKK